MVRIAFALIAVVTFFAALALEGTKPFGRLALALGVPRLAEAIFTDSAWQGVARFRAGDFVRAVHSFEEAGADQAYNRGNALVRQGRYAAALEAYDLALAIDPDHTAARTNFDLVVAFYAGTAIDPDALVKWESQKGDGDPLAAQTAQGSARAAGTGDEVTNKGSLIGLPQLVGGNERHVRKVFDDKFLIAGPRWLATLEDVPGAFLKARIAHEHKRRAKAGIGQMNAEDPG